MNLFIFFALPLATILLSIVLQKILKSPILVAITFFAIYLIVAFVAFINNLAEALIATIIYTIIAYITAYIVMIICRIKHKFCRCRRDSGEESINQRRCSCENDNGDNGNIDSTENNLLRISCSCGDSGEQNDLLTVNSTCFSNNSNDTTTIERNRNFAENQSINGTNLYGNMINRNNLQRRCYRRV